MTRSSDLLILINNSVKRRTNRNDDDKKKNQRYNDDLSVKFGRILLKALQMIDFIPPRFMETLKYWMCLMFDG